MAKDKSYWETGGNRRYVLDPDDVGELERESGVHEFVDRNPRDKAEDLAYGDYTRKHHMQAAAHHLAHMRASQANGNYSDAKRHKILYDMHLKELGLDSSSGKVPEEIAQHMNNPDAPRPMKFKPHKADSFFLNDKTSQHDDSPQELSKAEVGAQLAKMLNRVLAKSTAVATGPQEPAPGVTKPKEHVAQAYAPTIPGRRKASLNERRRGLLVPWQIDGSNVSKPSGLKQSELDKASVVDHKAGQQAAPGILTHPEDVDDTVDTSQASGVQPKFGYSEARYDPRAIGRVAAIRARARRGGLVKKDISPSDLEEGSADEQEEHKLGPIISTKIAGDHLNKDPDYYKKSDLNKLSDDEANVRGSRDYVDKELADIPLRDPAKGKPAQAPGFVPSVAEQKKKDGLAKAGFRYRSSREDPDDHGNPKEIAQDKSDDLREKAAQEAREKARPGYVSDEPTYKAEKKPYMGRDEGIRRSKLPPGAPGSSKDGVGVHVDKKKEANKKAARGKVKGD
jgi:hypothetical protein